MSETSDIVAAPAALVEPSAGNGSAPADATLTVSADSDDSQVTRRRWQRPPKRAEDARGPWYTEGTLLLATVIFGLYAIMSIARYERLAQGSWDLGMFTEAIKEYANLHAPISDIRGPGFDLLGDHFHPVIALIAPLFRLFPSAITLLVVQALLFAVSAVPITRLAIRRLGTGAGFALGIAYGLSWGLQSAADFDFHELVFAVPLLAFSLVALVDGRYRSAILWAIPLVLVKEDMGILVAGIGLLVALRGKKRWQGLGLAAFGLAESAIAILVIIPAFNPNGKYGFWQQIGGANPTSHPGVGGAVSALWSQFFSQADVKFQTVFLLLLATAFLALGSPISLITVIPVALRFISSNQNYYGTSYHYDAPLMAILFVASIDTLIRIRARMDRDAPPQDTRPQLAGGWLRGAFWRHGAVAALAVSVGLINSFPLNQYFHPKTMFTQTPDVQAAWHAMSLIPDGATVEATLNLLAPLASRTDVYWIGNDNPTPQYVIEDNSNGGSPGSSGDPLQSIEQQHKNAHFVEIYSDQYGVYVYVNLG